MEMIFDIKTLPVIVIFLVSIVLPMILSKKFRSRLSNETQLLLKFIKTTIDEDSGRIVFNSSIDSKAHPLFAAAVRFIDGILTSSDSGDLVRATIPEEFGIVSAKNRNFAAIHFVPLSNANNTFYTTVGKRDSNASLVVNISDGSAISDHDSYNSDSDKKRIAISCSIEGIMIDAINSKKCLISVEPFLLSTQIKQLKNEKNLDSAGVYLFLAFVAFAIIALSVCLTLVRFDPVFVQFLKIIGVCE
ncbi:hypothetical protein J6Z19_06885 [bacterium]|nr:hypothetical protein [bacterium]